MLRWLASAGMYTIGEVTGARLQNHPPDPERVARVTVLGATGDAVCLRAFHGVVERRLPSPLFRTMCEQVCYAPLSTAGYLTVARGDWTWTRGEFVDIFQRDMAFWGCTSYVGYRFVPLGHRYLYISAASVVFNMWRASLV